MRVTIFSNYLNHHLLPLCEELIKLTDGQFRFVAENPITQVRLHLGYEDMNYKDFVVRAYEDPAEAERLAEISDIIIVGAASDKYIRIRNKLGKPSFKFSERPLKRFRSFFSPRLWRGLHKGKPVYMLCSGAYAAGDFAKLGAYKNKCYNWGYFPAFTEYADIEAVVGRKTKKILWVGRFIDCKHADHMVEAACRLKEDGYNVIVNMIGMGELRPALREAAKKRGLGDMVRFAGALPRETVREQMELSAVYVITSDRQEGWGAVVNEAMNGGCAVVASHTVGAAATMIKDGENGVIYRFGDIDSLCEKIKYLLDNDGDRERIGVNAYRTVADQWNAKNAAERFIRLAEAVLSGEESPDLFESGVCSKMPIIKE